VVGECQADTVKMKQILLLGATFATGNMGVGALAAGALTVVSSRYPQATIRLLDYGHQPTVSAVQVGGKVLSIALVNLRFSWKLLLANNIALLLTRAWIARALGGPAGRWLIASNPWLKTIAQADVAVAVSGGDSFSDIYGLGRFFYVVLPQLLALSLGVKLIMLPQTLGPFKGKAARWMAGFLVRRAERVYSRDQAGLQSLLALLGQDDPKHKARFCFDLGFVVEPHAPKQLDLGGLPLVGRVGVVGADHILAQSRPLVGLNVSGLLLMGGYTRSNMFELNLDYAALVDALIQLLIEVKGADVLLIPHVFSEDAESDTTAMQQVHQRWCGKYGDRLFCVRGRYDQNEIKHVIGLCDFFVGSRMHACIAALSQCIPAVGVAYSDKFAGVFDSVGVGSVVADPRRLTLDETLQVTSKAFDERQASQRQLRAAMPGIKARVLALLDETAAAP
jgi:colanic acid/amylovoran biosynthesis protein